MASFYGFEPRSPLFLGTAQYPSPAILAEAVKRSGVEVVTVSLRRESSGGAGQVRAARRSLGHDRASRREKPRW